MEVILEKKQTLAKLASEYEVYPQVLKNVKVKDKKAAQDDEKVQAEVAKVTESLGSNGRILLRQSGTEPVVRVMVEASDLETCEKYVDQVFLDLYDHRFFQLFALFVDNLDTVIIVWVVAGRDHDTAVKALCTYYIRNAWCGSYVKQKYISAGCGQTCY